MDHDTHVFGDVTLQSGAVLHNTRLAYKTFGTLNAARSNVIVYPTSFGTHHSDIECPRREGAGRAH